MLCVCIRTLITKRASAFPWDARGSVMSYFWVPALSYFLSDTCRSSFQVHLGTGTFLGYTLFSLCVIRRLVWVSSVWYLNRIPILLYRWGYGAINRWGNSELRQGHVPVLFCRQKFITTTFLLTYWSYFYSREPYKVNITISYVPYMNLNIMIYSALSSCFYPKIQNQTLSIIFLYFYSNMNSELIYLFTLKQL
jgi:hypothetical protein